MRWIPRSSDRHSRRIVVLVDAKAVLGAAAKGRSSSPALLRLLRRLASLALAGDLLLRYAYVPSEDMPADPPSRGKARRPADPAARLIAHARRLDDIARRELGSDACPDSDVSSAFSSLDGYVYGS